MKKANFFHNLTLMSMIAAMVCAVIACGDDEEPEVRDTGDVVYTLDVASGGTGTGSQDSPATVQQGDTLKLAISQKCTYKDPNGSIFTCEPTSTIALHTTADTLCVKDIQTLTAVAEPRIQTSSTGTDPVLHTTVQTFNVGGKEITFRLAYEVFSHVNSKGETREMPYVRVNNAQYGTSSASQVGTRAAENVVPSVTGITVRPHATTRSTFVTDSALYDVCVRFNLDVESMNTPNAQQQNLSFQVNYLAIVETTHELPDPTMDYSYKLKVLGGTNSTKSPFSIIRRSALSLEWQQSATYTYFSADTYESKVLSCTPKATAKVYAAKDTLWVEDLSNIKDATVQPATTQTTGANPVQTSQKQTVILGEQSICVESGYEHYRATAEDGTALEMPYLMLGDVSVSNVSVGAAKRITLSGRSVDVYDVTVMLNQTLSGVGTPTEIAQTVQYVVRYVVAQEKKLVDVQYRKDFIIEEPHHNLPLATRYVVYRDKIYSNGETVTDTFTSGLCAAMEGSSFINDEYGTLIYGDYMQMIKVDTVAVTNPEATEFVDLNESESEDFPFGEKLETYELMGAGEDFNPETPKEGWYFRDVSKIYQRGAKNPEITRRNLRSMMRFYDRFLYIDGQIIDFWDMVMTHKVEYTSESKTLEDGTPAKVFTLKHTAKYLGMDFSITLHDVYVQKKGSADIPGW